MATNDYFTLAVSEFFFSIQGEGVSAGLPSLFIRLQGCHVACKWCDTTEVWKKGTKVQVSAFAELLVDKFEPQMTGRPWRCVITGGSPLLQQRALTVFLDQFKDELSSHNITLPVFELETDVTLPIWDSVVGHFGQINASPKLRNAEAKVPTSAPAASQLVDLSRRIPVCVKWVTSATPIEIREIQAVKQQFFGSTLSGRSEIHHMLMPMASTREELMRKLQMVTDAALSINMGVSPRLQLVIWDKATGV